MNASPPVHEKNLPIFERWRKAQGAVVVGSAVLSAGKKAKEWWDKKHTYSVTVSEDDVIYTDIHDWLLDLVDIADQRALQARSSFDRRGYAQPMMEKDDSDAEPEPYLILYFDDTVSRKVGIEGHQVMVAIRTPDRVASKDGDGGYRYEPNKIVFTARTLEGQQAVYRHLESIIRARKKDKRKPVLWLLTSWGSWSRRNDLPARTMESVVLAEGQKDRIVEDLQRFLDDEPRYAALGIPWHRGYLFHGPPGTGKTSIARALADRFGLDIFYMPLGDITKDTNLLNTLRDLHPRSLLLLEDVDIYAASTTDREAEAGSLSLSGLLNALDGVATPHGLITIMTTNDRTALDEAVMRPGRVDMTEEIGLPSAEQAARLFEYFYGEAPTRPLVLPEGFSVADISEVFKSHLNDPQGAEQVLSGPPVQEFEDYARHQTDQINRALDPMAGPMVGRHRSEWRG